MNIFDVLSLIGGLCLFLFGMNLMGESLEKSAGNENAFLRLTVTAPDGTYAATRAYFLNELTN